MVLRSFRSPCLHSGFTNQEGSLLWREEDFGSGVRNAAAFDLPKNYDSTVAVLLNLRVLEND